MARKMIDCREHPSEKNCTVAITADSADEVVDAAAAHAVSSHGHADSAELRAMLRGSVKETAVA